MLWSAALAGFMSGASLIIAIGAQNAFVLRQGLQGQYVASVVAICALSDLLLILCGVAGVGALIAQWPQALQWLRFGAAAFLLSYGLLAAQRAWLGHSALQAEAIQGANRAQALLACLAFTFLNPHVYLDTVVLLGSLSTRYPGGAQWSFALGAGTASVLWFSALGFGARLLQPIFSKPRAWQVLDAGIAAFMWLLCALLLLNPLR